MRALLVATLITGAVGAQAGGLDRLDQVDLIELEPRTSRALLVVILEDDRVNTRRSLKLLLEKINNYLHFVNSGQLSASTPGAGADGYPKIVVYGPRNATRGEMQNLAGFTMAGRKAGLEVEIHPHRPSLQPRPVPIKPLDDGVRRGVRP